VPDRVRAVITSEQERRAKLPVDDRGPGGQTIGVQIEQSTERRTQAMAERLENLAVKVLLANDSQLRVETVRLESPKLGLLLF